MSDVAAVRPHLERWFQSRRVVFWHDPDGQYADGLGDLDLPGVQTIRVADDEFGVKNRLLHDNPTGKSRTGCSTWSSPTGCSRPTALPSSRRISG